MVDARAKEARDKYIRRTAATTVHCAGDCPAAEVILMDEPCSALNPILTTKTEELIMSLKQNYTAMIAKHNMQQAARISDLAAFLFLEELIEYRFIKDMFESSSSEITEKYITGNLVRVKT